MTDLLDSHMNLAWEIFQDQKKAREAFKNTQVTEAREKILKYLSEKYKKFYMLFPEVITAMVLTGKFSKKAFERTLYKFAKVERNPKGFSYLQGYYAAELYKATTKHWSAVKAKEIWESVEKSYNDNLQELLDKQKEIEEELKEMDDELIIELKEEIISNMDCVDDLELYHCDETEDYYDQLLSNTVNKVYPDDIEYSLSDTIRFTSFKEDLNKLEDYDIKDMEYKIHFPIYDEFYVDYATASTIKELLCKIYNVGIDAFNYSISNDRADFSPEEYNMSGIGIKNDEVYVKISHCHK